MPLIQCDTCYQEKPIEDFPDLQVGQTCADCAYGRYGRGGVSQASAEKALSQKAQLMSRQIAELSGQDLTGTGGKVKDILSQVYANFGGPVGYASQLHSVIMMLSQRRPIPASVGHLMVSIMKLHAQVERTEANVEASQLTDEQLRRAADTEVLRLVLDAANDPAKRSTLEGVLKRHGLKLLEERPDEVFAQAISKEDQEAKAEQIAYEALQQSGNQYDDFDPASLTDDDIEAKLQQFCEGLGDDHGTSGKSG